jgi:hypothetical protein
MTGERGPQSTDVSTAGATGQRDASVSDRGVSDASSQGGFDRIQPILVGLLLVVTPALTLLVAYAVLSATRSVALAEVTLVEAVELYLVELAMFAVFAYLLYRLALIGTRRSLALDPSDGDDGDLDGTDRHERMATTDE